MSLCGPSSCGSCPLLGVCGDPTDLPPEPERPEHAACRKRTPEEDFGATLRSWLRTLAAEMEASRMADLPDVDPNEPKPSDAGCCGGRCGE